MSGAIIPPEWDVTPVIRLPENGDCGAIHAGHITITAKDSESADAECSACGQSVEVGGAGATAILAAWVRQHAHGQKGL